MATSRPAWARGLKQKGIATRKDFAGVAPRVGAWIETQGCAHCYAETMSRAPRGRVD